MKEEQLSDFRRNKLGFIFQDYNLLVTLTLTVRENILLPLALLKIVGERNKESCRENRLYV